MTFQIFCVWKRLRLRYTRTAVAEAPDIFQWPPPCSWWVLAVAPSSPAILACVATICEPEFICLKQGFNFFESIYFFHVVFLIKSI